MTATVTVNAFCCRSLYFAWSLVSTERLIALGGASADSGRTNSASTNIFRQAVINLALTLLLLLKDVRIVRRPMSMIFGTYGQCETLRNKMSCTETFDLDAHLPATNSLMQ